MGILPLWILDHILVWGLQKGTDGQEENARAGEETFLGSIREWMMVSRLPEVPDELRREKEGEEEILEIYASRRKADWVAPKVVNVDEVYYRLEESHVESGARPFRYRLRRLTAGVPGRSVVLYRSEGTAVKE